ncbi:MAG: LD-carboxypeptidase, partial [Candidatus Saccharimonadales bacterium]
MKTIIPEKLQPGDTVRIITPSRSMAIIADELKEYAITSLEGDLGLTVEFGAHVTEDNYAHSSSVGSRIQDLHEAFLDPNVKAIFTVIGGFNSNQLLDAIDWDIVKSNPKIFCGYSDITALSNAIYAKTGILAYVGPHFSTFGQKQLSRYTVDYMKKCFFEDSTFTVLPS